MILLLIFLMAELLSNRGNVSSLHYELTTYAQPKGQGILDDPGGGRWPVIEQEGDIIKGTA
jgi:hypothetical protein